MNAPTFDEYFSKFPIRVYKKHSSIINAGDDIKKIYYLKKGYVRLYSISAEGKELTLIIYKPGEFFPLVIAFLPPTPYRYWIETMTQSEIISVPSDSFISFFKKNPDLLLEVSLEIMKRLDRVLRRMEYLTFGNAYQKIASILAILKEGFGQSKKNEIIIPLPLTHRDIAYLVGMTRETASIEIEKLKKKKIIGYKGRLIVIKNVKKLEAESLITS